MDQGAKIAAAVVGGYILGRRKKAKLAIALGLYLAGKKLNIDPRQLANTLIKQLGDAPQVAALREQAQGELASVGKTAVSVLVDRQANQFADMLHSRTERLRTGESGERDEEEEEPAEDRESASGEHAEPDDQAEEPEERPRRRAPSRRTTGGGAKSGAKSGTKRGSRGTSSGSGSSRGTSSRSGSSRGGSSGGTTRRGTTQRRRSSGGES